MRRAGRGRRGRRPPRRSRDGSPASSPRARCSSSGRSPTASTCGTGRSSSTSMRTAPDCHRCRSTWSASGPRSSLSTASYYLVERPIRRARLHGWVRAWGAPLAGRADGRRHRRRARSRRWRTRARSRARRACAAHPGARCPGRAGTRGSSRSASLWHPSPANPLRVTILGRLGDARRLVRHQSRAGRHR